MEIVEEAMKGNEGIAMVPDMDGMLPIVRAAALRQTQMLYGKHSSLLSLCKLLFLLI